MGKSKRNQQNSLSKERRQEQARKTQFLQEQAAIERLNKTATLWDILMQTDMDARLKIMLSRAQVININNVADYLATAGDKWTQGLPDGQIPPFDVTFLEFDAIRIEPRLDQERIGVLINRMDLRQLERNSAFGLTAMVFLKNNHRTILCPACCIVAIDDYGRRVDGPGVLVPISTQFPGIDTVPLEDGVYSFVSLPANVAMFAFTLMNCRNVNLIDVEPNKYTNEKYERHFGQSLTAYKVLKVTPMHRFSEALNGPESDTPTLPKSLHIARGHFKDYRKGAGLFGKFKDIFWWDAHVRGDEKQGVTVKDYEVVSE